MNIQILGVDQLEVMIQMHMPAVPDFDLQL
jgi:hypothetical protein